MFWKLIQQRKAINNAIGGITGFLGIYYYYQQNNCVSLPPIESSLELNKSLRCELLEKEEMTHDTSRFRFALPTKDHRLGLPSTELAIASHILAHDDAFVSRAYTPISASDTKGYFDLLIKRYADGDFSTHFHDRMKIGDTMQFRGPVITLSQYQPNACHTMAMIAGGTGITPMYQIIHNVLSRNDSNDHTKLVLLYANKSFDDILLKMELDSLADKYPDRFQVHYIIEKKKDSEDDNVANISLGRINASVIAKYFPPSNSDNMLVILVCGPHGMLTFLCGSQKNSNRKKLAKLGGLLGAMGYSDQILMFSDIGVKRFC